MPYKINPTTGKFDFFQDEADKIKYDNSVSTLPATDVQDAIDELAKTDQLQIVLNAQMFS